MRRVFLISLAFGALATASAACKETTEPPTAPSPTTEVILGAVGASDGVGVGGSVPCVPFDPDCPAGTGYVYVLKRRLQTAGRAVRLFNRSVPGAVLSQHFRSLARDIGRDDVPGTFIDQGAPFIPANATHITIFAGGNDANIIAQNVQAGRGLNDVRGFVDQHVRQFGVDLIDLVSRLRARAPTARIVAINLPNLAAAPFVANRSVLERGIVQRIAVGLSDRVNALTAQNVLVADMLCDNRVYEPGTYSSDGFHPSDRGYAIMADLAYGPLVNGTSPAPSANCPQRTLVPVF